MAGVNSGQMTLAFPQGKAEAEDCTQLPAKTEHESGIPQDQPQPEQPRQGALICGFSQQQGSFSEDIIRDVCSEREAKTRASGLYPLWVL